MTRGRPLDQHPDHPEPEVAEHDPIVSERSHHRPSCRDDGAILRAQMAEVLPCQVPRSDAAHLSRWSTGTLRGSSSRRGAALSREALYHLGHQPSPLRLGQLGDQGERVPPARLPSADRVTRRGPRVDLGRRHQRSWATPASSAPSRTGQGRAGGASPRWSRPKPRSPAICSALGWRSTSWSFSSHHAH